MICRYELNSNQILVKLLSSGDNLGTWMQENNFLSGTKACILILNSVQNNPLGNCYAILFYSNGYWVNHPQYIKIVNNNMSTGALDCTNLQDITIA